MSLGDAQSLALPSGEGTNWTVSLVRQAYQLQCFGDTLFNFGCRAAIVEARFEAERFPGGHMPVKAGVLGQITNPLANIYAILNDVLSEN